MLRRSVRPRWAHVSRREVPCAWTPRRVSGGWVTKDWSDMHELENQLDPAGTGAYSNARACDVLSPGTRRMSAGPRCGVFSGSRYDSGAGPVTQLWHNTARRPVFPPRRGRPRLVRFVQVTHATAGC